MPANLSVPQADPIHPELQELGSEESRVLSEEKASTFSMASCGGGVAPRHLDFLALATLDTRQSTMRKLDSAEGVAGSGVAPGQCRPRLAKKRTTEVSPTHSHSENVVFTLRTRKGQ